MTKDWTIFLPFAISRLLDIVIAPIFSSIIIIIFYTNDKIMENNNNLTASLILSLAAGLVFGLIFGLKWIFQKNLWLKIGKWLMAK